MANNLKKAFEKEALTVNQLERQDFVDNNILLLLNELNPNDTGEIDHDIELISKVRDVIQQVLVEDLHLCTEQEFYPYF